MKLSTIEMMRALIATVERTFPGARSVVEEFPSGAGMLDVWYGGRFFNMGYFTTGRFGIDEVLEGEGFDTSYRYQAETIEDAAEKLLELLREVRVTTKAQAR